jgi:hypothetical protein
LSGSSPSWPPCATRAITRRPNARRSPRAPDDYFAVVTDRDRDKITRVEQDVLRTKRIGVLGLSVGGEAAVTLTQEHLCGHLVLADFDRLDLSSLNRLGAGADDLGLPKTTVVARLVARLDPYLSVTVFDAGVTAANADAFLDGLDLLVEECDDLTVKYDVRRRARARALDVVYAADERGFLSVEPYGQHPDLAPFHGLVPDAPRPRAAYPTPHAYLCALTAWLGGWDGISARSRASLARLARGRWCDARRLPATRRRGAHRGGAGGPRGAAPATRRAAAAVRWPDRLGRPAARQVGHTA